MQYMGGKAALAKYIMPKIMVNRRTKPYVEPFLGGANVMSQVWGDQPRIGGDNNKYLIALWKALQDGWIPPVFVTREEYDVVKSGEKKVSDYMYGYIGFCCSFGARFFRGYAGIQQPNNNTRLQNYQKGKRSNILRQVAGMNSVELYCSDYKELPIPKVSSIIYCDPPYAGVEKYNSQSINHTEFWQWCREQSKKGHEVYISEYNAPPDFYCLWKEADRGNRRRLYHTDQQEALFTWKVA